MRHLPSYLSCPPRHCPFWKHHLWASPTCFFTFSSSHCSFCIIRVSSEISHLLLCRSSQYLPLLSWSSWNWNQETRQSSFLTCSLLSWQADTQVASYSPWFGRKHQLLLCSSELFLGTNIQRSWWCFPCPGLGCCPFSRWPKCRIAGDLPELVPTGWGMA